MDLHAGSGDNCIVYHLKKSVRKTHLFLSEEEIHHIKEYVPQAVGFYQRMFLDVGFKKIDDEWYQYRL